MIALPEAERKQTIVGSQFDRIPEGSTPKYTRWANALTAEQLYLHRFRCVTLIQPTWFFHRSIWELNGGYEETYPAHPEDMVFFYQHLQRGGKLLKVEQPLVIYRFLPNSASSKIHRLQLLKYRLRFLQDTVVCHWPSFSIWGAGRDGRKAFNALDLPNQQKVAAFADINPLLIGTHYTSGVTFQKVPIIHFSQLRPPFITCVCPDRCTEFMTNLSSLGFREGVDYYFLM
jgi:hypothetical protein